MQKHIATMARLAATYKDLWRTVDMLRTRRGDGTVPPWPEWCFFPLSLWQSFCAAFQDVGGIDRYPASDCMSLACLAAWRPGQDIFRFEPEIFEALTTTPMTKMPTEILHRLPTWCVYIETPEVDWIGSDPMRGFFVWLDSSGPHLMLIPDYEGGGYVGFPVALGGDDLGESLRAGIAERMPGADVTQGRRFQTLLSCCEKMLSLVLYLCSTEPDVVGRSGAQEMPAAPTPTRTKKTGWRLFPPEAPRVWRVGETIARDIRAARAGSGGTEGSTSPHIRRAHWHGFWRGTRVVKDGVEPTPRRFDLKWLPPIAVGLREEE